MVRKQDESTSSSTPTLFLKTASRVKLTISPSVTMFAPHSQDDGSSSLLSPPESEVEMHGYRLICCKDLERAVGTVGQCSKCQSSLMVREELSCRRGVVSRLSIQCSSSECNSIAYVTDPYSDRQRV